jgi:hypothetical protein
MKSPLAREAAQKWLAFGAIATVAIGVSFASNAFKNHLKSTLPEPAPKERTPLVSSTPPVPAPTAIPTTFIDSVPEDPDEQALPATDPRTPPFGTPRSSLVATPAQWGHLDGTRTGEPVSMRYAPFHSRASQIFALAAAPMQNLSRAFVVCRGSATNANVDVHLRVTLGAMPEMTSDGEEQFGRTYVTQPLADVEIGQRVTAVLSERRSGTLVPLARLDVKLGDAALTAEHEAGDIECAALSGDALQDRIARDAGRADSAIARLAALRIDPTKVWALDPMNVEADAQRRIGDLAALVGWADPRVKARVAAFDAAKKKNTAAERRALEQVYAAASREVTIGDVAVAFDRITCNPQKCEIALVVVNNGTQPLLWSTPPVDVTFLVDAKDHIENLTDEGITPVELASGERRKLVLDLVESLGTRSLVQLCIAQPNGTRCGMIRLR